jgi:CheY-like chemotaxis protein
MAKEHLPDVVLLDLHLPDIDGEEVFRALQDDASTRGIPVVIVTADATEQRSRRLLDAGVSGYLSKPIEVSRFLRVLSEVLSESTGKVRVRT